MTTRAQILPHLKETGSANMAMDEALLEHVARERSSAYIRTYEWSEPTLSLGYFQSLNEALAEPRFRSVPIVRRATGGGALWHDREITYSVIIPADHAFARHAREFYRVIHEAMRDLIRLRGLAVARRGEVSTGLMTGVEPTRAVRPFLCFKDRDPDDLVSREVKIVGSAQRRRSGAVLQHGSLLLGSSDITPELRGLTDLLDGDSHTPIEDWSDPIVTAIAEALGCSAEPAQLPEGLRSRARELESAIYANSEWTGRR